jgi:hypothetical protein
MPATGRSKADPEPWTWAALAAFLACMLLVDLTLFGRRAAEIGMRHAIGWTALGLAFALLLLGWQGNEAASAYLAGLLIEKSLSIDNLFVFALVFGYLGIPTALQRHPRRREPEVHVERERNPAFRPPGGSGGARRRWLRSCWPKLNLGLAVVLVLVGAKMVLADVVHIPVAVSLAIVVLVVGGAWVRRVRAARAQGRPRW